jgi:hypothetical protein
MSLTNQNIGNTATGNFSGAETDKSGDAKLGVKEQFPSGANFPQPKGIASVATFTGAESTISNKK